MRKISKIIILAAVLSFMFTSFSWAFNPPGMVVKDDDPLRGDPWSDLNSVDLNNDNTKLTECVISSNDESDIIGSIIFSISPALYFYIYPESAPQRTETDASIH